MRLHEAKNLSDDTKHSILVSECIFDSLSMVNQAHLWHWQTKSFAAHKALGDFYESLRNQVDQLAELYMGAGGVLMNISQNDLQSFDKNQTADALVNFRNKLNGTQAELMKKENSLFHSVGDNILDIVKEVDKLLYLLTLE